MTYEIILPVECDDPADARDLADEIRLGVQSALREGRHAGVSLPGGISVRPVPELEREKV